MTLLLLACAKPASNGEVAWAVDYASVQVDRGSLSGQHVWVFFDQGWEKDQDERYHNCSLLQSVEGEELADTWSGCEGCIATYEVQVEELQHDCESRLVSDPSYSEVLAFGIGEVPEDLQGQEPYEDALGWYLSWAAGEMIAQGYAWPEGLEFDREVESGWADGQVYTLWPAYAWDLSGG